MSEFNPKRRLIMSLSEYYQVESIRGSDVIALNSKAILYVRYNKNAGATKNLLGKFWFGVTESEYQKYCGQNFFVVCACVFGPEEIDYLVFPSDEFDEIKKDIALRAGQWKFNLLKTNEKRYLLQIPRKGKYDVTEFLNYFDFSPKEFRRAYSPHLGEFQPSLAKEEEIPTTQQGMPLEDELIMTAKDSSNPKNFELALEKFLREIGFPCERIGGPGETDIVVFEPVRFIVDGKSTRADSKSAINFTRIKRHMREHNAGFMVVVSVGFDPAVGRDAEMEGATLVSVQTLITLLKIHREHMLSPFDYIGVLKRPGILIGASLEPLYQKARCQADMVNKALVLLANLDFSPRSIDEIKGRMDVYCEQKQMRKIERTEIESLLSFLSHALLDIIGREDNRYFLRFTPSLAQEKLRNTIRTLYPKIAGTRNENCKLWNLSASD